MRSAFVHPHEFGRSRLTYVGWALLMGVALAGFSPLLAIAPLVTVALWRVLGGDRASFLLSLVGLAGGVAGLAFVLGSPGWLTDQTQGLDVNVADLWPIAILIASVPLLLNDSRLRTVGLTGGLISLASLAVTRLLPLGPGPQEAILIMASFGAALVVAASLDNLSRNVFRLVALAGGIAVLVMSVGTVFNGRLGLPAGDVNERLSFTTTLSSEQGPGRVLFASTERDLIPGQARPGPGFWYRVLDGTGTTQHQVWLPPAQTGDEELEAALARIATGSSLRPGRLLAPFAIDWVVLEGASFRLDEALHAQLDLVLTPLDPESRVYENRNAVPLAGTTESPWVRSGTGFEGEAREADIPIAVGFDDDWQPDAARNGWSVTVDGREGRAWYSASTIEMALPVASIVLVVGGLVMIALGRRRS